MLRPHLKPSRSFQNLDRLQSEWVLVDREYGSIRKSGKRCIAQLCEIGTDNERRSRHGPEAHVHTILLVGQALHPNHHHVRIVVEASVLSFRMNALIEVREDAGETGHSSAVLRIRHDWSDNIAASPPNVRRHSTNVGRPGPGAALSPIAD